MNYTICQWVVYTIFVAPNKQTVPQKARLFRARATLKLSSHTLHTPNKGAIGVLSEYQNYRTTKLVLHASKLSPSFLAQDVPALAHHLLDRGERDRHRVPRVSFDQQVSIAVDFVRRVHDANEPAVRRNAL